MTDLTRRPLDDDALASALRDLATGLDWPNADMSPDVATRVRAAIVAHPRPAPRPWWRPGGRGLALALLALLAFAAVAGAVALGLPGLRLILADPGVSPPAATASARPSSDPSASSVEAVDPGSGLGLGMATDLDAARTAVDRPILLPSDSAFGDPDAVYIDPTKANAVAMVWAPGPELPAALEPGVGMILMSFDGTMADEFYNKLLGAGTDISPVRVNGQPGFWIDGDPHFFFFEGPGGRFITEERRWVGDALVWSDGGTTYRLESPLGRERSIEIAESLE